MEASETASAPDHPGDGLFPYERIRPGQDRFLEDARNCLASRTHLLAHAPTGLGKTAVSLAAGMERASEEGGCLLFLTSKQSQHHAAVEALRHIRRRRRVTAVDMVAREDMCLAMRKEGMPCLEGGQCYFRNRLVEEAAARLLQYPLHVQEAKRLCLRLGTCPYLASQRALGSADCVVCDYNQAFSMAGEGALRRTGRPVGRTVMVVDEAHNLPARISEGHSFALGERELALAMGEPRMRMFRDDLEAVRQVLLGMASKGNGRQVEAWELDEALEERCGTGCAGLAGEMLREMGESGSRRCSEVVGFLRNWSCFGAGSARFLEGPGPRLRTLLLDVSLVSAPVLEEVHGALLMSGTLHPPEMFAEVLGLEDRCACRRYASPFPPENRALLAVTGVSSRFQSRGEEMYQSISRRIAQVAQAAPGNMAVFFPSYEFMSAVTRQLRSLPMPKQVMADSRELGKNERDAMVQEMRREGERALFAPIGGSFAEGVDFRDNLLSAVVVVGLPIPPPSEDLERRMRWLGDRHSPAKARLYAQIYPSISKVLQAAGRAIRSEGDRAAVVLLDDRYLLRPVADALPEDFRPVRSRGLTAELEAFFSPT
jgi:DNA excision repair protein ERCC-2